MGIHRHSYRPDPPQQGPQRFYGATSDHSSGGPFFYTPPDGEPWRVFSVTFIDGRMLRTDTRHRVHATHRAFVARDGRRVFVPFTDIVSRGSTARTLCEQLVVAVPREAL